MVVKGKKKVVLETFRDGNLFCPLLHKLSWAPLNFSVVGHTKSGAYKGLLGSRDETSDIQSSGRHADRQSLAKTGVINETTCPHAAVCYDWGSEKERKK